MTTQQMPSSLEIAQGAVLRPVDIHAIGAANNLLAGLVEAHILHGNKLGIDPLTPAAPNVDIDGEGRTGGLF